MENKMFCYQCEQTMNSTACTVSGVCGKVPEIANCQDELINSLIHLANTSPQNDETSKELIEGLFKTLTNVNFDINSLKNSIKEKGDFDIKTLWEEPNLEIKSLKSLVLFGLKGVAAYAYHALVLGYRDDEINKFFFETLQAISKNTDKDELLNLVLKTGEINLKTMELLDRANTKTYGKRTPVCVETTIEKGPFIVVSGHDLKDLEIILKQTENKGINVYTHGEMLPCHGYLELKKYKHLKGNFGTAWQNQQVEFDNIPAPVVFTSNCIMPPRKSYKDRVFTTNTTGYEGCTHIGEDKNFAPVIDMALQLKGYDEPKKIKGINGGSALITGFGHEEVLGHIDKITELIKTGKLKHIFLVGGCDGAKTGRNYYTDFVLETPPDTLILTLACGKYRFNDMCMGDIEGIPRLLDLGQCNDAYSAIKIAKALTEKLNCTLNELPLSFVLSWYEQKAVAILLTLFYLKIENIKLGPSLPAFISEDILKFLVENFKIKQITTPKEDLAELLN